MGDLSASQLESLRLRFETVGRLLGVDVAVGEGDQWRVGPGAVEVGLGFFAARGHPANEAEALALLELWGSVREARVEPVRVRRRRSIATVRPELEPLLAAIDRMQAAGALLTALPALRDEVAAGVGRGVPDDIREWPRHLQWVSLVLLLQLAPGRELRVGDEVREEAERVFGVAGEGGAARMLRLAMAPDAERTSLQRLERALALTLSSYLRLFDLDAADRGLTAGGGQADPADDEPMEGSAEDATAGTEDDDSEHRADDPREDERGDDRHDLPAGELFASQHSGFLDRVLATPLPAQGSLVGAMLDDAATAEMDAGDADRLAGGSGQEAVTLADYRERTAARADAVARMREVWQRVIAERVALRHALSRRAYPEGEELHPEALAGAVAEVKAGVPRPDAFRRRAQLPRRTQNPGNTDYVLAVDRSGSMWGRPAEAAADTALIMLEGLAGAQRDIEHAERELGAPLELGIRTALVVFDAAATLVKPLAGALTDEARRALHAEIRNPGGGTNDAAAMRLAAEQLGVDGSGAGGPEPDGIERRRIVILISDGDSNDPVAADAQLRALRRAGAEVFGIGIGSDEIVRRFAPTSAGLGDPAELPETVQGLIERSVASGPGA